MDTSSLGMAVIITLVVAGCGSGNLRLQSSPSEAEVELVDRSGSRRNIGKTPLNISSKELGALTDGAQLEVSKTGHISQGIFLPSSTFAKMVEINIVLPPHSTAVSNGESSLQEVASVVADIQKDIQARSLDLAQSKLTQMIGKYPNVSTFYSLMGNVHYLERRLDRALASYRKALELNSTSTELSKVIEKLESMNGGSR